MGLFAGVEKAQAGQGGVYFLQGLYIVEVDRFFTLRSRKGDDLAIVEAKVIASTVTERPIGSRASWVVNMRQDAALGNIKGFIAAANDCDQDEVDEEACETAVSDANPLGGARLHLECTEITTRAGSPFTLHRWAPERTAPKHLLDQRKSV